MDDELVALLRELVAIPSMNPYRADDLGGGFGEAAIAARVADFLRDAGLAVEVTDVSPGRPNVVADLDGPLGGDPLLFVAHLDTVPVEGMTIPPFDAEVRDGCVHGRGACDNKGSLAAMLVALRRVAHDASNRHPIRFAATCDEESGFTGIDAFVASRPQALAAFVGEPTALDVIIAHRGAVRCQLITHGKSAHSSHPDKGINAIYRMTPILAELEALAGRLAHHPPHPLTGTPTLSVGIIQGGTTINTVPDRCLIEVDRRTLPGESLDDAWAPIHDVASRHGATVEVVTCLPAFEMPRDAPVVRRAAAAVEAVLGRAAVVGAPYGTEAATLVQAGIPAVVLGPGRADKAHAADESVPIPQLEAACRIYRHVMTQ